MTTRKQTTLILIHKNNKVVCLFLLHKEFLKSKKE